MMNFLRKHKIKIFLITIFGFLAGSFVGFGSYLFGDKTYHDTVAVVNKHKIPYKVYYALYNSRLNMLRHSNSEITDAMLKTIQNNLIRSLVQDEIVWQQTKNYGIDVTDEELAFDIQNYPYFINERGQFDIKYYYTFLNNLGMTPKDFENLRRKQLASNKLQIFIASSAKTSAPQLLDLKKTHPDKSDSDLMQIKANEVLNDWFESVKRKTKIKITMEDRV